MRANLKYNFISARSLVCVLLCLFAALCLGGCKGKQEAELFEIPRDIYERESFQTVEVMRGDLKPVLSLTLKPSEMEEINESVNASELRVKQIYVSLGDFVNVGDPLISFNSEETEKKIRELETTLEDKELQLSHYLRLYEQDFDEHDDKYAVRIEELADEVEIAKGYLSEERSRYNANQLYASKAGTVSYISKSVMGGYAKPGETLVTIVCGDNTFDTLVDSSEYFSIGDTFTAVQGDMEVPVEVVEVLPESEERNRVVFRPALSSGVSLGGASMSLEIAKSEYKGAIYVPREAVKTSEQGNYVYVVKDNGFPEITPVVAGETVDDVIIIREGLEGTERVALKE